MDLVRCANGHFYDKDKDGERCPYCAQAAAKAAMKTAPATRSYVAQDRAGAVRPASVPVRTAARPVSAAAGPSGMKDDNVTVGYYSRVIGVEPVVGWLVCIEGEYQGESFKLKSGRNFIGRAANMDVVLSADPGISRVKHAVVIYDPRGRQFIVTAGESKELCYLNGDVVLSSQIMEAYDVLELGSTSLMLVPCCSDRFTWEDGLVRSKKGPDVQEDEPGEDDGDETDPADMGEMDAEPT